MSKEINITLLEKYLDGSIAREEVLSIQGEAIDDEELDRFKKEFLSIKNHIKAEGLKGELEEFHNHYKRKTATPRTRVWSVAASIALIGAVCFILINNKSSRLEFEDYYRHFDQLVAFRNISDNKYISAFEAYTDYDYLRAFELFDAKKNAMNNEVKFYFGMSALGSRQFDFAIEIFKEIGTNSSEKYYQQVRWYLSLAYWQSGDIQRAKSELEAIKIGEFNYQSSRELLKKLAE